MTTSRSFRNAENAVIRSYLAGFTLSTAGSSATFTVAPGMAADSTNVDWISLGASISKTTAAWAVGNNNGALDTGAIAASTWYHAYAIKRIDTGVVDILISLSATAPTLPANYTLSRRIGAMKTNASSQWTMFHQVGDTFIWDVVALDVSTAALGTAATSFTLPDIPTGFSVEAICNFEIGNASGGASIYIYSPLVSDQAALSGGAPISQLICTYNSAGYVANSNGRIITNASAQIRAVGDTASTMFRVGVTGWVDHRGRDA